MEPIKSGRTPFALMPERVLIKWSMSRMQASSNQHSEDNWDGDLDGKDSGLEDGFCIFGD